MCRSGQNEKVVEADQVNKLKMGEDDVLEKKRASKEYMAW